MTPSATIKKYRREAIDVIKAEQEVLNKDEESDFQERWKIQTSEVCEESPFFWIHGIMKYLDEIADHTIDDTCC